MKNFILPVLLLLNFFSPAQKYALIDKQMTQPITFTNTVTVQNSYAGFFPVEKDKLNEFVAALEKIALQLTNAKKSKPQPFKFTLGATTFTGLKIVLKEEDRLDVVLSSALDPIKSPFHLCDGKINNINNAFFVNTWAKYIKDYMPTVEER